MDPEYPLHDQMAAREAEYDTIMNFLYWLEAQGIELMFSGPHRPIPVMLTYESLILSFFDINGAEYIKEREHMLGLYKE